MKALQGFTVWTVVVFCCLFEICQASDCKDVVSCDNTLNFTVTNTSIEPSEENCNLTINGKSYTSVAKPLEPGAVHSVYAQCSSTTCCFNVTTQPEKVSSLNIESTTSSLSLKWDKPIGKISGYDVKWTGDDGQTKNTSVQITSVTISALTPGVQYNVTVIAVAGDGLTKGEGVTTSVYTKPGQISKLTVTGVTTSSMYLNWTKPEGQRSFYIVQWVSGNDPKTDNVTEPFKDITGLTAGVEYTITVTAVAGDNETKGVGVNKVQYTKPEKVSSLNIESTTSSLSLKWDKPTGKISSYDVKWTGDDGQTKNTSVPTTSVTISALTPGVQYNVTVIAVAGDGLTKGEGVTTSVYTKPGQISKLTVTGVTTSSMYLNWTKPEGHSSFYIVQWVSGNDSKTDNVTEPFKGITNLTAGVEYTITVTAVAGDSQTKGAGVSKVQYTKPGQISKLTVTGVTTSSMNLSWTKPEGQSSFYIVQWVSGNDSKTDNVTEPFKGITNLTAGVEYTITVTAVAGDSETKGVGVSKVQYTKPGQISKLTVTGVTTSSMYLNWTEPEGQSSFYIVQWVSGNDSKTDNVTEPFKGITNLTAGVEYTITVTAVAGDDWTRGGDTELRVYTKPGQISKLTVTGVTTSSMNLSWTKPEGQSSFYIVQWVSGNDSKTDNVTEPFKGITNLTAGVEYTITVTAVAGDSETKGVGVSKVQYTKPGQISKLTVTGVTTSSMYLSWTKPEGQSSFYIVQWVSGNDSKTDNVTEPFKGITNLTAGVEYTITVTAVAGDDWTRGGDTELRVYTKPGQISKLTVTGVTTSSMNLNWTEPEGQSSFYIVQWVSGNDSKTDNVTEPFKGITNLTAGVEYTITVTAVAGDSETKGVGVSKVQYTKPGQISKLTVTGVTTSSMNLSWTEPEGQSSFYIVQWVSGNDSKTDNVTEPFKGITNLTAGVEYTITVTAVAGDNWTRGGDTELRVYTKPGQISKLTVTGVTTSSMNLSWTEPEGQSSFYIVQWVSGNDSKTDNVTEPFKGITNLTAGVEYTITVTAVAGDSETKGVGVSKVQYTKPGQISKLTVTGVTTSSMYLNWTEPEGHSSFYIVQWVSGNDSKTDNVTEPFKGITNLTAGVEYTITVTAVAGDNETKGVGVSEVLYTRPMKPDVTVNHRDTSSLNISWTLPGGHVDHYEVELNQKHQTDNTWFQFSDLSPGRLHTVTVTAVAGNFKNTSESEFATYPLPPQSVKIAGRTNSYLNLSWDVNPKMQDAPNINYSISYEGVSLTFTKTTATLPNLQSGFHYNMTVKSVGPQNLHSTGINIKACTNPNPVLHLGAFPESTTSLKVNWAYPSDHKPTYSYRIYIYDPTGNLVKNDSLQGNSKSVTGLKPGTEYKISVITVLAEACQSTKEEVSNYTKPAAVTITEVSGTTTSLTVSWDKAQGGVDHYSVTVYNSTGQGVQTKEPLSKDTFSTTFTGLKPGVQYCARVFTNTGQLQAESNESCNATFPNPPRNLKVSLQTLNSLNFTWDTPEDMQPDQYHFNVSIDNKTKTPQNHAGITEENLQSGTPHKITVITVGVNDFRSEEVTAVAYTKPYPVTDLQQTEITPDSVTLIWNQTEHKPGYRYLVEVSNSSGPTSAPLNVTDLTVKVQGLISGTNYSFTVTTQTADGTAASPQTVSYFTRPYGIKNLMADTLNTTSISLTWTQPSEYKPEYTYVVETSGCRETHNKTVTSENTELTDLTSGTNCSFCVTVKAENGIESKSECTSAYTKPEKVEPHISSQGLNNSILVSWAKPPGNVEVYRVSLNDTSWSGELNSTARFHIFENLSAGRIYTAVVETQSGNFSEQSESVSNATFPNPPGVIAVQEQTTRSIHVTWIEAPLMSGAEFHYQVEISPNSTVITTTQTNYTFAQLLSGTSYNITVTTVGVMGFKSETVRRDMITTRPFPVKSLQAKPGEKQVVLTWSEPEEYKPSYRFKVMGSNTDEATENLLTHTMTGLVSGSSYWFTVTTETSDGTTGEPMNITECTNASPVPFIDCKAPNETNATITWTWKKAEGQFSNFSVQFENETSKNPYPPSLEKYENMIKPVNVKFNEFSIEVSRDLLNNINGPITHVGVKQNFFYPDVSKKELGKYLESNYDDWKNKKSKAYLATIINATVKTRNTEPLILPVGDETTWHGYGNGILEATKQYKFTIVVFTKLELDGDKINAAACLYSSTQFDNSVTLPQNPVVIGMAVGVTLGIFLILLIVLIGFVIYWRRLSKKETSDIQIHSLRSFPVRVEDYEVYYKKQKADSNCGFAEEYEDLKVVGTAQSKTHALTPENKPKNRYNNVLPYDASRVKLSIIHGNPIDDYINANYIPGYNSKKEFIAAQGPLPATVNDFWRMIWEKNVHTVVMLTRCNEQGRVKCEQYWTAGTKHYENINVTTTSEIPLEDWTIRDFDIKNVKTAETRSVRHFHFTAWPDHGVPETTELLISFRHLVREHMDQYRHSPTIVHCSAGVGRTGTFIAIDRLIFQIERENVVDVYGIVHDMRMHRSLMVQTEDQYIYLHQCALDVIRSRTGNNVDLIYQNTTAFAIYENF
ncbi:receptor-type tyrosine-protein phosphatase eta [Boleophthalmus pectinirostris]|uniref:receptor-type tyrosine-protein phosphatase eta n=1 Tax=Boleophthalmus pectinirostris TaxID=150288 RepID=UPI00242A42F1|nr:receptor-type tyrosine-protein phosphatase eta [Boleophthalmus pectinirostris]